MKASSIIAMGGDRNGLPMARTATYFMHMN